MSAPLADRIRPQTLDDVVGQEHLLGKNKVLRRMVETGNIPNLIFYGPSGVGKTTVASIIAKQAGRKLYKLNGTTASTADIREVVEKLDTIEGIGGVILYLDEIQYLNKKQQQTLLEFIENGSITLIASTTENPYFYVYNAILSRSTVFEFKPVSPSEVLRAVDRAFVIAKDYFGGDFACEDGVTEHIASACGGDVRKAINAVEMLALASGEHGSITLDEAKQVAQKSAMRYDRDGDAHYDILSAFQKSIRGSDENAGLHYLARLLEAGDLISPCRRLLVIASEDIGLAYPQAVSIVKACVDSAMQLGLPEARIPLAQAVILLCTSPKSNSAICAIDAAMSDVRDGKGGGIPESLRDGHYAGAQKMGHAIGYQYAHNFKNGYVKQQYLPDSLKDQIYYQFGENKNEAAARAYREKLVREASSDNRMGGGT
ncbi:replication-associated recombination protein A [Oscillospiraceae bacterium PP1C4]